MAKPKCNTSKYGGQALMEGVMMRGTSSMAIAVRSPKNEILLETTRLPAPKPWRRVPIIRGVVAFISSLVTGTKTIMRSAELSTNDDEEEIGKGAVFIATALGLVLGIAIFILLPSLLTDLMAGWFSLEGRVLLKSLLAGGIRIILFVSYLALVSLMKDIRRTFMYHGAEHRAISCLEKGMPLEVGNVQKCSTRHDRCGTTFLFLVIIISILVFALTSWLLKLAGLNTESKLLNIAVRLVLLPLVAGLSYEALKGLAAHDNFVVRILKAPGLALQRMTTRIPDDTMAEVALFSLRATLLLDQDPSLPAISIDKYYTALLVDGVRDILRGGGVDDQADCDWIVAAACNIKRSQIPLTKVVDSERAVEAYNYARQRAEGAPLSQVLGIVDFYGIPVKVNKNVLSPRPETELLAEQAIARCKDGTRVLDVCCGSACIALAVHDKTRKSGINVSVTASDISADALAVATDNVDGRSIEVVRSDLFDAFEGRQFDLITANPPYIATAEIAGLDREVRDFEPHLALDGGEDGLNYYRRIASQAPNYLAEQGALIVEVGAGQAADVVKLLEAGGLAVDKITNDYAGIERIITAVKR